MAKLTISDKTYQKSMEKIDEINNVKIDLSFDERDINAQIFLDEFKQTETKILSTKISDLTSAELDEISKLRTKCGKFKGTPQWKKYDMANLFKQLDDVLKKRKNYIKDSNNERARKKQALIKFAKIFSVIAIVALSALTLIIGGLKDALNANSFSLLGIITCIPVLFVIALSIFAFVKYYFKALDDFSSKTTKYWYVLLNMICTAYLICACVLLKGETFTASNYHMAFIPYAILFWANFISFCLSIILFYHCLIDLASVLPKPFQIVLSCIRLIIPVGLFVMFVGIVTAGPTWFYLPFYLCLILTLVSTLAIFLSSSLSMDDKLFESSEVFISGIGLVVCVVSLIWGSLHRTDVKQIDNTTIVGAYSTSDRRFEVYHIRVNDDTAVVNFENLGEDLYLTPNAVGELKGKVTRIILTDNVTIVEADTFDDFDSIEICVWFSSGSLPEKWSEDWTNSYNVHYNYTY